MTESTNASGSDLDAEYPYKAQPAAASAQYATNAEKRKPLAPPAPRRSGHAWNTVLIALLWAGFAACDTAILPLSWLFDQNDWGALCVYSAAGAILAQGSLLAIALVFARGAFWRRLAFCSCLIVAFWFFWALGFSWTSFRNGSRSILSGIRVAAFSLPLAFLAIQAPLWWLRVYRGWQLVHESNRLRTERPSSILDYLIGTGIVAVSLSLARIAPGRDFNSAQYWAGWSVYFGSAAAISLISLPLALWLILEWRRWRIGFALLVFYGGAATVIVMATIRLAMRLRQPNSGGMDLWDATGIVTTFVAFTAMLGMGLMLMRSRGSTLLRARSRGLRPSGLHSVD
jgi:hypothetical protein